MARNKSVPGEELLHMEKRKNKIGIIPGSGNVFADLGLRDPEEKQTKVRLAVEINRIIAAGRISGRRFPTAGNQSA